MATATGTTRTAPARRTESLRLPRTTGALSGILVMALGVWGALIPFIGPYFHYAFGSYQTWHFTSQRLWLDILPGAVAVIGGFMLLTSASRTGGLLGGWLAVAAGAWFAIGPTVSLLWHHTIYAIGFPAGGTTRQMLEWLGYFYGLGALIIGLAAFAMGRYFSRPRLVEDAAVLAADAEADARGRRGATTRAAVADAPAERTVADAPAERAAVRDEPVGTVPADRSGGYDEPAAVRDEPVGTVPAERSGGYDEPAAVRDQPVGAVPAERSGGYDEPAAARDEPVGGVPAERSAVRDEPVADTAAANGPTTAVPTNTAPAARSGYAPESTQTRRSGGLLGRFRR